MGVIGKLRHILPRHSLIGIYKSFVRPQFVYCDIIYDQPGNESSATKLKGFNTILLLQVLVLLQEHHQLNCTMNLALNHLNAGDR